MELTPSDHMLAFFRAFIKERRRDRWIYLFENDQPKLVHSSHRLIDDIEPGRITDDLHLRAIPEHRVIGAFYDMTRGELGWADLTGILHRQPHFDAIFSIDTGTLAAVLFHEKKRYVVRA
jgi:hypothetical protein